MARAMSRLGSDTSLATNKAQAAQALNEAIRLAEESDDMEALADSLMLLGTVEDEPGAIISAFEKLASLEPRYRRKRRFIGRLSTAASMVRDFNPSLALNWYNRCLSIARQLSDAEFEGAVLHGIAKIERGRGNEAKAEELEALAHVMCPLPDVTELIKAAESRDGRSLEEAVRSLLKKQKPAQ